MSGKKSGQSASGGGDGLAGRIRRNSLRRRRGNRNRAIRSRDIDQGEQGQAEESCEELGERVRLVHGLAVVHGLQCDA